MGAEGPGVLVVSALGPLDQDASATLFQTRIDVSLPQSLGTIRLRPEVAFLEVDWNFGERALDPCSVEVARVEVVVNTAGATQPAFSESFECVGRPVMVPNPLALSPYSVDVRAFSAGGFPIYAATDRRVFDRGPNRFTAVLMPLGGELLLDWRFSLMGEPIEPCDDARVGASTVSARVQGLFLQDGALVPDGSRPITADIDCSSPRPASFPPARFNEGRELELELRAEGTVHTFRSVERFTMPSGDAQPGVSTLAAVGAVEVAVQIANQDCVPAEAEALELSLASRENQLGFEFAATETSISLSDVPYGSYQVTLSRRPALAGCPPLSVMREVSRRQEAWPPLDL